MDARATILRLLAGYVTDAAALAAVERGAPLVATTSLDSLDMMAFIWDLEKEFRVSFDPPTLERVFATIDTIAAYVERARRS